MDERTAPFSAPADGKEEIFGATYRVLLDDGYSALSIQRIADEATLSKSTIYHHFESKNDLLLQFSETLLAAYIDELLLAADEEPTESIQGILDVFIPRERRARSNERALPDAVHRVYLEMRTQAVHDQVYRDHFDAVDRMVRERIASLIAEGIEQGSFRAVDPDAVASLLYVCLEGTLLLSTTTEDDDWTAAARRELNRYLRQLLYAEDARTE